MTGLRPTTYWLATSGMAAVWSFTADAASLVEDARGALEAGDLDTAVETVLQAYLELGVTVAKLEAPVVADDWASAVCLAASASPYREVVAALPACGTVSEEACRDLVDELERDAEAVRARIPVPVPALRTPAGFFPALRTMRELEALRRELGLDPFPWTFAV